jgi:two-component system response regulator HydG
MVIMAPMISTQSTLRSRVLIVDDDAEMRDALGIFFSGQGHECELASDAATALGVVERVTIDAVICDVRMEGMSGLELLDRVKRTHPALPFVVITAMGEIQDAVAATKRGAYQYMTKPCDMDELRKAVLGAIEEGRREGTTSFRPPSMMSGSMELVGNGPAMRTLQACIDFVAASTAPVIVTGETGAGKELVARAIHARGARRAKPFVAVNTSAIPGDLLEAEVFGHVRGAFTGAIQSRKGLLMEADGGTLLLDEIGDMPIGLQAKLLRVLQFGEVRPVGSDRPHLVDVRVIASTHRDLPALVRDGTFREDLYFRLNVLPVVVPPLREHREDIPALAAHFLAESCARAPQSPVRSIGADALRSLTEAPWPGNVRELASLIERSVVFGSSASLRLQDLASMPGAATAATAAPWSFRSEAPQTLRHLSRAYTEWVLAQTGGNKERAAEILGIDLSTLYRWQRARSD